MRLAIEHYLAGLVERGELDVLLRNLLVAQGFEVLKRARRGEKEYGVDVAALRVEGGEVHLYLFQVKKGDLDRATWDAGANGVRASLNEAIDAPYSAFARLRGAPARRHLITVFNGEVREDVRRVYDGFVERETQQNPGLTIGYWNISTLVGHVEAALVDEGLLPGVDSGLLKKTLAFADVPYYGFAEFQTLLSGLLVGAPPNTRARRRLLATVRLLTRMVAEYARRGSNHRNALVASEITLLALADWAVSTGTFGICKEYAALLEDYAADLSLLFERLSPELHLEHGLAMGGLEEQVEYPLRTFELLGWLALLVLISQHLGDWGRARWACDLLGALLVHNPSARRPLLDEHGVDIALAALALAYSERGDEAAAYASWVLGNLGMRADLSRPLPELHGNVDAVLEAFAHERPPEYEDGSSTLIPLLFELLLWAEDTDDIIRSYAGKFARLNLQTWYPPADYSPDLYRQELQGGVIETGVVAHADRAALLEATLGRQRHFGSAPDDAFAEHVSGIARFVAWRHFRTPVFPGEWRTWIVGAPPEASPTAP
ncbi:hypothetical protein [Deinococcus yunweiensis]|uniref:hypothetical protein n=1 Tax=Deinococcus yunweiensis TaxID=367282 RepID=UPI00398F05B3